jgi:hypothetical protein
LNGSSRGFARNRLPCATFTGERAAAANTRQRYRTDQHHDRQAKGRLCIPPTGGLYRRSAGTPTGMNLLRLPFTNAEDGAATRGRAADLLAGQPVETVQDVLLVITELVGNVVQHTEGGGELRLILQTDAALVEVHDHSRTFPQLQRPDLRRPGGRGLLLVAAIAQRWGWRPTPAGKVVWAHVSTSATTTSDLVRRAG